jgi:hypothetical protein
MILTVVLLDLTAFLLGALLAYLSYVGYNTNDETSYAYACAGFGALAVGAVAASLLGVVGASEAVAEHARSFFTLLGFGLVVYGGEMAE